MMMHAYNPIYLSKVSRAVGNMLHDAVYVFEINGNNFLQQFIQSGIAEEIENGNPKYSINGNYIIFHNYEQLLTIRQKTCFFYGKVIQFYICYLNNHHRWEQII